MQGLADCQLQGLTEAVGVSNFKPERVRSAAAILQVLHWNCCTAPVHHCLSRVTC